MSVLKTKTLTVSGAREDETTFPNLIVDKIAETLEAAGFEIESGTGKSGFRWHNILWNGKSRFYFCGLPESTSGIAHIRVAAAYRAGNNNWGSSYAFAAVNSTSTDEQAVTFTISFFATGDFAYFLCDPSVSSTEDIVYMSASCYDEDGNASVLNWKYPLGGGYACVLVPLAATEMDNNWMWDFSVFTSYYPYAIGRCFVRSGFKVYNATNNLYPWYIVDGIFCVATNATIADWQIVTIDGQQYVHIGKMVFVKYDAANATA